MTVDHTAFADDGSLDFYSLEVDHWWKFAEVAAQPAEGNARPVE